ncbi:Lipid A core - O-antigen ligase and related enzymes [Oligella urethralis]|uniref:O-antigen ligase family protein n=1 Tax=Oligella urethralis TaxID=90245 RepID=UPI000DFE42F3|nr:O-antigen ligase family protein [Oligella urethralis]SUA56880.1 Lipid A core - O-antigen ligase and related enzymes [Oligella urethralis]
MSLKINPHKCFFIAVLLSTFLGYLFNSGLIAYGPLILCGMMVILYEFISKKKIKKDDWLVSISWLPYVFLAAATYITNPYEGRYLTTYLLSILILPIATISFCRLFFNGNRYENYRFIYKALFWFLIVQLIICFGQISTYTLGFGFPVSELYAERGMVTGTFINSNDLGAVALVIIFIVLGLEKFYFQQNKYLFWLIVVILLIITGSRSAILLAIFIFLLNKASDPKRIVIYTVLFALLAFTFVFVINNVESQALSRMSARLNTIVSIFQQGIYSDSSISMRVSSYLHFIQNLPKLGFGTGEINNYFKYSANANFRGAELLFQNPHSLVVEIGYWLGWLGLLFFFIPISFLLFYSKRKLSLIVVLLIVSMIPSSILSSMIFFLLIILSFFDYTPIKKGLRNISYRN